MGEDTLLTVVQTYEPPLIPRALTTKSWGDAELGSSGARGEARFCPKSVFRDPGLLRPRPGYVGCMFQL